MSNVQARACDCWEEEEESRASLSYTGRLRLQEPKGVSRSVVERLSCLVYSLALCSVHSTTHAKAKLHKRHCITGKLMIFKIKQQPENLQLQTQLLCLREQMLEFYV